MFTKDLKLKFQFQAFHQEHAWRIQQVVSPCLWHSLPDCWTCRQSHRQSCLHCHAHQLSHSRPIVSHESEVSVPKELAESDQLSHHQVKLVLVLDWSTVDIPRLGTHHDQTHQRFHILRLFALRNALCIAEVKGNCRNSTCMCVVISHMSVCSRCGMVIAASKPSGRTDESERLGQGGKRVRDDQAALAPGQAEAKQSRQAGVLQITRSGPTSKEWANFEDKSNPMALQTIAKWRISSTNCSTRRRLPKRERSNFKSFGSEVPSHLCTAKKSQKVHRSSHTNGLNKCSKGALSRGFTCADVKARYTAAEEEGLDVFVPTSTPEAHNLLEVYALTKSYYARSLDIVAAFLIGADGGASEGKRVYMRAPVEWHDIFLVARQSQPRIEGLVQGIVQRIFLQVGWKHIWLGVCGSSWLCLCLCVFWCVVMLCLFAWDQLCPRTNIFVNSLFSCKDRASERHRPHQREKKRKPIRHFFFLRFGQCRTRLGPYNCVSSEKLFCTGTRMVRENGKSTWHQSHKQTTPKPKATRKSPSQICVSPQNSEAAKNGAGPKHQHPHKDLPWDTVTLATVSSSKTCKLIIHCGSSWDILHGHGQMFHIQTTRLPSYES